MPESFETRLMRWKLSCFPCFLGTGARVTYIAADMKEVRLELPLWLLTRNYFGTIFGGSMFSATDPIYTLMLVKLLGRNYIVWDKSASVRFRKPGRSKLFAQFTVSDEQLTEIKTALESEPKIDRMFRTKLTDAKGEIHAEIERLIHISLKPKGI